MSVPSTEIQALGNTLGAVFFGVVLSSILFGVSTLQVYYYFHYYPHDTLLHKSSAGLLWALDTTHISLAIYTAYYYGVLGFGNGDGLKTVIWSIKATTALNVVIILLVQSLYAYRVWLLGGYHHGVLGYLVAAVVLGGFGIGIVLAYETFTITSWSQVPDVAWAVESSFAASTAIDVVISVAMCHYLRKSKGIESYLNSRISTLMQYTLSCGIFTSACSLSCLFTFILLPNTLIFLALTYLLTRLYVNSFFTMMNARRRQRLPDELSGLSVSVSHHISSDAVALSYTSPSRSHPDPESQRAPRDKYDWVDTPLAPPQRSLSDGRGRYPPPHVQDPAVYESPGQPEYAAYTRQW
ncbi:hypothetical protein B0H11DRAFT_2239946 [Mycena galericulata]|nr:hypothetical protein B0H11DRAFT_2239946 [Mycena galericulata]